MTISSVRLVLLATVVVTATVGAGAAVLAGSSGVASAGHGDADANYTVEPQAPSDREPGATDVQYGQIVVAQAGTDFETLERMKAVYDEGSWANCGSGDADEFGIDRGNTHSGYETDESLEENVKRFSAGEDVFEVEFHGEDDIGASTHLDDGDAIVSLATCMDNPEEPGWYQISGSSTGVTEDGEEVTIEGESHYFWICDCEDEQEAREELGPPPSEDDGGAGEGGGGAEGDDDDGGEQTATSSGEDDDAGGSGDGDDEGGANDGDGGDGDDSGDGQAGDESGAGDGGDDGAADDGAGSDGDDGSDGVGGEDSGGDDSAQDAPVEAENGSDDEWDDQRVETPADGSGPGFGPGVAVVGLLAAVTLLGWRD